MKTRWLRATLWVGAVMLGAVAFDRAHAKPPGRAGTCAAIAEEARAFVTTALKAAKAPVPVEIVMGRIAPLGKCIEPVVGGGQWALVLDKAPEIRSEEAVLPEAWDTHTDSENDPPATPFAYVSVYHWTPVFVTADGRRVALKERDGGGGYAANIDATGRVLDHFAAEQVVEADIRVQPFSDGSFGAAFGVDGVSLVLVRFANDNLAIDPAQTSLPEVTGKLDVNKDGLDDLVDSVSLSVPVYAGVAKAFELIALGRGDGTYTTADPFIEATYRKRCEGLGRSPWALGWGSSDEAAVNLACGLIFGVPKTTIAAGLELEGAQVGEDEDGSTMPTVDMFQGALAGVIEWLEVKVPVYGGRGDGFRAIAVESVTGAPAMKAFGVYRFDAAQAVDGDLGTSWQPKSGRGAWIELKLESPEMIVALDVANGLQRKDRLGDLFVLNSRLATMVVTAGGKTFEVALDPTRRGFQRVDLPEPVMADAVRIGVKSTAKGARWDHVALSEVVVLAR